MRLLGEIQHEERALQISSALLRRNIEHRLEARGSIYQIWILDEDRLEEAKEVFLNAPSSVHLTIKQHASRPRSQKFSLATIFFLALCTLIFLVEAMQHIAMKPNETHIVLSPVQKELLFDLPPPLDNPQLYGHKPYWQGLYEWILLKAKTGDVTSAVGPLFIKIREGEVWRLFSPALLHGSLLHILFNMIWLWVLGRPMEMRIGTFRMLLFTLIVGIATNTLQYLMSGPLFLGYSGIIMGLAGFTWMRERIAPWEGYPLNRSTVLFLGLFVLGMLALQLISFFVQLFTALPFILNIANAAHIFGALLGALLGRLPTFAWKPR
jgi:GlpG protein